MTTFTTTEQLAMDCTLRALRDDRNITISRFDTVLGAAINFATAALDGEVDLAKVEAHLQHYVSLFSPDLPKGTTVTTRYKGATIIVIPIDHSKAAGVITADFTLVVEDPNGKSLRDVNFDTEDNAIKYAKGFIDKWQALRASRAPAAPSHE